MSHRAEYTPEPFLKALFGEAMSEAYVTGFKEDPQGDYTEAVRGRMWRGGTYERVGRKALTPENNTYVCISTFRPSADPRDRGEPRRQKALFRRCYAVMIDDIGPKVSPEAIRLPLTAMVETSPGNFQGWYAIDPGDPDAGNPAKVDRLLNEMIRLGLSKDGKDPGMKGVTRYGRLPGGLNRKSHLPEPWRVVIRELDPERVYTLSAIAAAYGADLDLIPPSGRTPIKLAIELNRDELEAYNLRILEALADMGCEPREHPNKPGGFDVLCPWRSDHTGGVTSGSMFFVPGYTDPASGVQYVFGGYRCHHGHCADRTIKDVLNWINKNRLPGIPPIPHPSWLSFPPIPAERQRVEGLAVSEKGAIIKTAENLERIIHDDPLYRDEDGAFRITWDRFADRTWVDFETVGARVPLHQSFPGRAIPQDLVTAVRIDLEKTYHASFNKWDVRDVLAAKLNLYEFDSLTEWARSVANQWDGTARLETWLMECAGVEDTVLNRWASKVPLLAAASRAFWPGIKYDQMVILRGAQGIGKSIMLQLLAPKPEWYASLHADVTSKDMVGDLQGKLIVELEELQTLRRSDHLALKGFLSRTVDRVRLAYEARAANLPRRVIFWGTTNEEEFLPDNTGNRRFWIVDLPGRVNLKWVETFRDQIWAEAAHRAATEVAGDWKALMYSAPEVRDAAADRADRAQIRDVWEEVLQETLARADATGPFELSHLLVQVGIPVTHQRLTHKQKAGVILRKAGYVRKKVRWVEGSAPTWRWVLEV